MKSKEEVVAQFNEDVNMTAEELKAWLEDPNSKKAGTGVGIESGHKIAEILEKNPEKDPEQYEEEDVEHMRKVVGYNKRHLAQEDHLKETKTREELENAKSTISLKSWGHDPLKTLDEHSDDVASADGVSDGHDGYEESQTQQEVEDDAAEEGDHVDREFEEDGGGEAELDRDEEPKEAKKRKLVRDELEPDEEELSAEEPGPLSCGDDQEVEVRRNGGVSEEVEGGNGQDEPPRKKAKTHAAQ